MSSSSDEDDKLVSLPNHNRQNDFGYCLLPPTLRAFCILQCVSGQMMNRTLTCNGICGTMHCRSLECLRKLKNCVVVVGNLSFTFLGMGRFDMFKNMRFDNLKEITGYMAIYQVPYLDSIAQLFPNLVRIRGRDLLHDYALIIYDMYQLNEIGLYSLLKIDRGGVIIWGGPDTCYVDTIDWKTIAPQYRHVLNPAEDSALCSKRCRCSSNALFDYCWNNMKCQRFLDGPEGLKCDDQCLGCRLTNPKQCWLCRHYTHNGRCVPKCPEDSIILEDSQYCITVDECLDLGRWVWNRTCITSCPDDYVMKKLITGTICEFCPNCTEYCGNVVIRTLSSIQAAHKCVYINGSLIIHIRGVSEALEEMRYHLNRIQVVMDFIEIHDSISLTSIDFLPSLQRIGGRTLVDGKYSLVIRDNPNLQTVFLPNVTKKLIVEKGTIGVVHNPMLCWNEIEKLIIIFPVPPNNIDIPHGLNAYSSGCAELMLALNVTKVNETSAVVMFVPLPDVKLHYSILYVRIPPGKYATVVPETCSEYEWHAVNVPDHAGQVELKSLRPASTYLVCIESYDLQDKHLARSSIVNFSTLVGKPEPPFIVELAASSPDVAVVRWVDHLDYSRHITRYELDITLIEIHAEDITASNQCKNIEEFVEIDVISRHAVVRRPPSDYGKGCESMCGVLSTAPHGAMVEENFDICDSIESGCNEVEEEPVDNSTFGIFVRTSSLRINSPSSDFQVGNLAPYRDYRFSLRACTVDKCSRSTRSVVRTLPSMEADVPTINSIEAYTNGIIKVFWDAPLVSNGPVLAYILEIIPDTKVSDVGMLQTQTWCMQANQSSVELKSEKAVGVRLCSLSLASRTGCTGFKKLVRPTSLSSWGWAGVMFAVSLCIFSVVIGYIYRQCQAQSDIVPLVNITSTYRTDSEPPFFTMSDFTPSLHVTHPD